MTENTPSLPPTEADDFVQKIKADKMLPPAEMLSQFKEELNDGKNTSLEIRYPQRFTWTSESEAGKSSVTVQLGTENDMVQPDVIKIKDGDQATEVEVSVRIWMTLKQPGKIGEGTARCFQLGKDGQWYVMSADSYTRDDEKETNLWSLENARVINAQERETIEPLMEMVKAKMEATQ